MYKLKIEIAFTDKYTGEDYEAEKVYSFEEERAKELLKDVRGLVSLVEKPKSNKKDEEAKAKAEAEEKSRLEAEEEAKAKKAEK